MVVVEQASGYVGQTVEVEFIRSLQTAAGKMMFAKRTDLAQGPKSKNVLQQTRKSKPTGKKPVKNEQHKRPETNRNQPKQRRSVDREAALLDLVDKQQ